MSFLYILPPSFCSFGGWFIELLDYGFFPSFLNPFFTSSTFVSIMSFLNFLSSRLFCLGGWLCKLLAYGFAKYVIKVDWLYKSRTWKRQISSASARNFTHIFINILLLSAYYQFLFWKWWIMCCGYHLKPKSLSIWIFECNNMILIISFCDIPPSMGMGFKSFNHCCSHMYTH